MHRPLTPGQRTGHKYDHTQDLVVGLVNHLKVVPGLLTVGNELIQGFKLLPAVTAMCRQVLLTHNGYKLAVYEMFCV